MKNLKKKSAVLATPDTSLGPAGRPTKRRMELLADWVELYAKFELVEVYRENLADILSECSFAKDQDDAHSIVSGIWRVLSRRKRNIGENYPFEINNDYICLEDGQKYVYIFLLLLSAPEYMSGYSIQPHDDIRNEFEKITVDGISEMLPGWDVFWCGATSTVIANSGGIIQFVADTMKTQMYSETCFSTHQDGGLDFLAIWSASDQRSARPALWGQCATGLNWSSKVNEPNFNLWGDALRLVPNGVRALSIPFALDKETFTEHAVKGKGWIVDRERLSKHLSEATGQETAKKITNWITIQEARLLETGLNGA